jgi:L-asparagine transporter-like permease
VDPSIYGMAGVLSAAAIVFFSYTGFEAVANLGEETRNPKRDLPIGLLGTLGICALLYVGVSAVLTGMVAFRTPLNPVLPIFSALMCLALMTNLAIETRLRFLVWLAIGFVIYFLYGARRSQVGRKRREDAREAALTETP